jgi:hypothetical protein
MFPYKEDLVRYDFEVDPEDEWMWKFPDNGVPANGVVLPVESMNGVN